MTTVAYTAGVMAADTQMTRGPEKCFGARKIFATAHYLAGFSGSYGLVPAFLEFIKQHEDATEGNAELFHRVWDNGPARKEDCSVILVNKRGKIFYGGETPFIHVDRTFEAIGTGSEFALGAMSYGAGARKAVKIACSLDKNSGGVLMSLSLQDIG